MSQRPAYFRVFLVFARNSLVRDMTFRSNFLIEAVTSMAWMLMNLAFYVLIYSYTSNIAGWDKYQFFLFLATGLFINSLVQTFFMTNVDELSDLIRTGALDFALVKPIDTQFLVSLRRVDWSSLGNFFLGGVLAVYALLHVDYLPGPVQIVLYPVYVLCGAAIYYSLMIAMAVGVGVDGTEPDAVRLLVLRHHIFPLSDGDLQWSVGHAAAAGVYVSDSGVDRGQRAGAAAGSPACRRRRRQNGSCRRLQFLPRS